MRARMIVLVAVCLIIATLIAGIGLLSVDGVGAQGGRTPVPTPERSTHDSGRATTAPRQQQEAALPDGFVPHRLERGETPPQFVLVSFDGAGWHEMWQHWFDVADRVPFRFTGFLSGTYLLTEENRDVYQAPGHRPGASQIGFNDPEGLTQEIDDLNHALADGHEIGTHFNGHFCAGNGSGDGGADWSTGDWDAELTQFFDLLAGVRTNNHLTSGPRLDLTAADIHGERTPCLEGSRAVLYPALRAHDLDYDSSLTRPGLAWPTRSDSGVWQLGMGVFPVHGTLPDGRSGVPVISMDYNYYFTQRGASSDGLSAADSARDRRQVLETYRDMYHQAYDGNRAPIVLGNHFNDWNNGAYRGALTDFVLETCDQPETQCVTFSDLVAWLEAQRPKVLARLQGLAPVGAG